MKKSIWIAAWIQAIAVGVLLYFMIQLHIAMRDLEESKAQERDIMIERLLNDSNT